MKSLSPTTIAVCAVVLVFSLSLLRPASPPETHPVTLSSGEVDFPLRLQIPAIKLDTHIEHVGLTEDGEMDTPHDIRNVGWYKLGTRPGEIGSAVIDGHYGWEGRKPSAFDTLHTLEAGDKIHVEMTSGETVSFIVRETRTYNPDEDASDVFNSFDGNAHLNLITCDGEWDKKAQTYSERIVVFTDREE